MAKELMSFVRHSFQQTRGGLFAAFLVVMLALQSLLSGYGQGLMAAGPVDAQHLCISSPNQNNQEAPDFHSCACGILCQSISLIALQPFGSLLTLADPQSPVSSLQRHAVFAPLSPRAMGLSADVRGPPVLIKS